MADATNQTPATGTPAAAGAETAKVSTDPIAQAGADKAAAEGSKAGEGDGKPAATDPKAGEGKKEGEGDPAKKDGEKPKEGEGLPGEFKAEDFKLPEGFKMNEAALTEMNTILKTDGVIKDGKLTTEGAQAFVNLHAKVLQEALGNAEVRDGIFKQMAETRLNAWADQTIKAGYTPEQLSTALAGIEGLKIPELTALVKDPELGIGSNQKVVALFLKVGQRMTEAGFTAGAISGSKKEAHEVMFDSTSKS